jgi:hypothetical protein
VSCANLDSQVADIKKTINANINQSPLTTPSGSDIINSNNQVFNQGNTSKQDSVNVVEPNKPVGVNKPVTVNKPYANVQSAIQASNNNRVIVPDPVPKMNLDMEEAKSPKLKEHQESQKQYKDLISQADSVFRCSGMTMMPVTIVIQKNSVKFLDMRYKDVSNLYSNIQVKNNLVYFTQTDEKIKDVKFKYVLDGASNKLIQLVDATNPVTNQNTKNANENNCKKIK